MLLYAVILGELQTTSQTPMMLLRNELDWWNIVLFSLSPFVTFIGVSFVLYFHEVYNTDLLCFLFMLCTTGIAVNAGYHIYYSHRSYQCHRLLQIFYLLFGAAALQNSALSWASNHRKHHRFVDRELDPYNITRGFFWAHMGWLFYKDPPDRNFHNVPDLQADRLVMWQHKYYPFLGFGLCFLLPLLVGYWYGRPWQSLLWGGLVRVVFFHHVTFLINSAGHCFGTQPYSRSNSSRDNWLLAILMFGGGYHNFHHTFPRDYRCGVAWSHWDPTKWWIWGLSQVGLTWNLRRTPISAILRSQMKPKDLGTTLPLHGHLAIRKVL